MHNPRSVVDHSPRVPPALAFWVALGAAYVAGWSAAPLLGQPSPSDLDTFFWPAADRVLHGHLLTAYALHGGDAYPNANGPLGFLPLVPLVALAEWLRLPDTPSVHASLTNALGALLLVLMTREAVRLINDARGGIQWRIAAPMVFLVSPALLIGLGDYGHIEQPLEMWLLLMAIRRFRSASDSQIGALTGLAILSRTTAALASLPLIFAASGRGEITRAGKRVAGAVLTVAVGLAPFVAADASHVIHSLLTYRSSLPIAGGSFWVLLLNTPLAAGAQQLDIWLIVGLTVALTLVIGRRRPDVLRTTSGLAGCMAIGALCFAALSKTVYAYYLVEPWILCSVWWLARCDRVLGWRAFVPALLCVDTFILKWVTSLSFDMPGIVAGIASSLTLVAILAIVSTDLLTKPGVRGPMCGGADREPKAGTIHANRVGRAFRSGGLEAQSSGR